MVAVWIAAIRLGAWIVPSDPFGAAPELAEHILRTSPVVGVCAEALRSMAEFPRYRFQSDHAANPRPLRLEASGAILAGPFQTA